MISKRTRYIAFKEAFERAFCSQKGLLYGLLIHQTFTKIKSYGVQHTAAPLRVGYISANNQLSNQEPIFHMQSLSICFQAVCINTHHDKDYIAAMKKSGSFKLTFKERLMRLTAYMYCFLYLILMFSRLKRMGFSFVIRKNRIMF